MIGAILKRYGLRVRASVLCLGLMGCADSIQGDWVGTTAQSDGNSRTLDDNDGSAIHSADTRSLSTDAVSRTPEWRAHSHFEATCPGAPISFDLDLSGPWHLHTTWTVTLSDPFGEVANGIELHRSTEPPPTTLTVTVPQGQAPGTAYVFTFEAILGSSRSVTTVGPITVHPRPHADFSPRRSVGIIEQHVAFHNNSLGATHYLWDFGDGANPPTSHITSPRFIHYDTPGRKTVSLVASNDHGCTDTYVREGPYNALEIYSCNAEFPPDTKSLNANSGVYVAGNHVWVCPYGELASGGGRRVVYVAPGGQYTFQGGGSSVAYIRAGGTFVPDGFGGSTVLLYEGVIGNRR